ncbi:unnamed protein product, partial [Mesorhabditis belari]|uniref:Uncharacterized protein n=1 Tax=Mesorhabditis belari TaxID=2138241 RepID=A0AAF3J999_9BILA
MKFFFTFAFVICIFVVAEAFVCPTGHAACGPGKGCSVGFRCNTPPGGPSGCCYRPGTFCPIAARCGPGNGWTCSVGACLSPAPYANGCCVR